MNNNPTPFHIQLRHHRLAKGLSQDKLAEMLGCDSRTISRWEKNLGRPRPDMVERLSGTFNTTPEQLGLLDDLDISPALAHYREEMEEAPSTAHFYGRTTECEQLTSWITEESCRMIVIVGLGGMGKTTLAAQLVKLVRPDFPRVFWRSLKNAPPLTEILKACLQFLSSQGQQTLPTTLDEQLSLLIRCLRAQRCLLILDNLETILQPEERAGRYRPGYENYAELFQRLGEVEHQSCLLLTSREKPTELAALEDLTAQVRSFHLKGLPQADSLKLLRGRILQGSDEQWAEFIQRYAGNPLALKLVAASIREVFGQQIAAFLQEKEFVFDNINDLIHQHFQRLSAPERELMYWLTIEREPITRETIRENQVRMPGRVKGSLLDALGSLSRRSLIETTEDQRFFLQPVIMEYATNDLVQLALTEFERFINYPLSGSGLPTSWQQFAFLKALANDYIREAQTRLILGPLAEQLVALLGRTALQLQFALLLERQRQTNLPGSYLAGNVLNLLQHLRLNPRGIDCSDLTVRQAYMQNALLPEINFVRASFRDVAFTNPFGAILSVAFNPAGDLLAAGTATGDIWVYKIAEGVPLQTFKAHTDGVWALSFSSDGQMLASGSDDATAIIWDVVSGKIHYHLKQHRERVRAVAFSPDGSILASGCNDRTIRLWDTSSGQHLKTLQGHTDWVWSLAFHPSGHLLASGSTDKTLRLWDPVAETCLTVLQGHTDRIRKIAFHPSGHLLASASDDQTVRFWNIQEQRCEQVMEGHTNRVWSLAFSRDGTILASGSEDCTIRLWETSTALCLKTLSLHTHGVRAVAFGLANLLASGGDDQKICLSDSNTGNSLKTIQGYPNRVWNLTFARKSGILLSASEDQRVRLWDVQTGRCVRAIMTPDQSVRAIATSLVAPLFATVGENQNVDLWNLQTGQLTRRLLGHKNWVRAVAFSPDGRWLASGGEENQIFLWEAQTGERLRALREHTNVLRALAFSPDNRLLASGSDDTTIRLWDPTTGTCLHVLSGHSHNVRALAFHPTRPLLFSAGEDRTVRAWDTSTGEEYQQFPGHTNRVFGLDLDPTGNWLASCSDDLSIRVWNLTDNTVRIIEQAHESRIRSVVYSPDGTLLASCSDNGKISLWDAATLAHRRELNNELPYEHMNITGATGLTQVQKTALQTLGAIEE